MLYSRWSLFKARCRRCVERAYRAFFTNLTHGWTKMTFPLALCFFCCFGLGFGVFALSRKARTWGGDDVTTPITFCSNCTPLLFNASLHIDLERSSSKAVTLLDNGCGLTILAILFLFSLCVSKIGLFPLFSRRRTRCGSWINLLFLCYSRCRAGMWWWAAGEWAASWFSQQNGFPTLARFSFLLGVGGNSKGQFTIFYS